MRVNRAFHSKLPGGHRAPECPWNPKAKAMLPLVKWAPTTHPRTEIRKINTNIQPAKEVTKEPAKTSQWKQHSAPIKPKEMEEKKTNHQQRVAIEERGSQQKTNIYSLHGINDLPTRGLAKKLGVITLAQGETDIEEAIKTLRGMSESFKARNWNLQRLAPGEFIIELPNDNALNYLLSKSHWQCKEGRSYFRVTR